eukprot:scaffold26774_cov72-Phaeocystis_antarctica.AAC.1
MRSTLRESNAHCPNVRTSNVVGEDGGEVGGGDGGGGEGANRVTTTSTSTTDGAADGSSMMTPNTLLIASR